MTTKEQLLQYFRGLDIATLEKLKKYSELLIIPDEDLLVNATMSQMVSKAHNLADALFPEWTDRSKSDFGEFLVELFALFSEKDFWYINAFANEGTFRKMRSYSNAFSKASSMGYYPTTCKGAKASFKLTFNPGSSVTYERGDLTLEVNGVEFTNDEAFSLRSDTLSVTVQLHEGKHIAEDVVYNGYNVFIRKANVDIDSIILAVDGIQYQRVKTFGFSSPDSHHYMVLPEEDGSCVIYFGSNGFGVQPTIGKPIRVEYRICHGVDGNIPRGSAKVVDSLDSRKVYLADMASDSAVGGCNAESLTSIKEKAPNYFNSRRAAINENIAQEMLNNFTFIHKSNVEVIGRDVVYRVIPSSGAKALTSAEVSILNEEFAPYIMAGYSSRYTANTYLDVIKAANPSATKMILDVLVLSGYDSALIEGAIRQIVEDATNPLVDANYGGSFEKTSIDVAIRARVPGVQSVVYKILVGGQEQLMSDVHLNPTEIFQKIDQDNLTVRINVV